MDKWIDIDFGVKKPHWFSKTENDNSTEPELIEDLKDLPLEYNLAIETGCPYYLLIPLFEQNREIFLVDSQKTAEVREELDLEKTDENDVIVIRETRLRYPKSIRKLNQKKKKELKLKHFMGMYRQYTKTCASMKNRQLAISKRHGKSEIYEEIIKRLEKEKKMLASEARGLFQFEMKELERKVGFKGFGEIGAIRVFSLKHPKHFKTKTRYLSYMGLTSYAKESHKYSHIGCADFRLISKQIVMATCPVLKPFYDKIKATLREAKPKCSSCPIFKRNKGCRQNSKGNPNKIVCKGRIDNIALNRIATKIAGRVWEVLHDATDSYLENVFNDMEKQGSRKG